MTAEIETETHIGLGLLLEAADRGLQLAKAQTMDARALKVIVALRKAIGDAKEVLDRHVAHALPPATGNGWRLAPKLYFAANSLTPAEIAALVEFEARVRRLKIEPGRRKNELPIALVGRELAPVNDTGFQEVMMIRPGQIAMATLIADLSRHVVAVAGAFQSPAPGVASARKEAAASYR